MVLVEKPSLLHFATTDSVVGLQFHAHTMDLHRAWETDTCERRIERFVAAAGTQSTAWESLPMASDLDVKGPPSESLPPEEAKTLESPGDCQISCQVICVLRDHTPHYVVTSRFSPCGTLLASCDNRTILIFQFIRFVHESVVNGVAQEVWRSCKKMTDIQSDIFDLCWHNHSTLVTGSIGGIKIWNVDDQNLIDYIKYTDGFVTGVCSFQNTYIAAESNNKHLAVWVAKDKASLQEKTKDLSAPPLNNFSCHYDLHISDTELLALGPSDLPYYRRPSFDVTGRFVAFPYGERGNQCFGIVFSLLQPSMVPYRFRGHYLRVNCVAFSATLFKPTPVVHGAETQTSGQSLDGALSQTLPEENMLLFTLYAQASIDGALSVWKVYYLDSGQLKAECLFVLKPRFIDEQASVTDMAWTGDGMVLAVGADDGSITLIRVQPEEIKATPYMGKTENSALSSSIPLITLFSHLHLFHEPCSTIFAEFKKNHIPAPGDYSKPRKGLRDGEPHVSPVKKARRRVAPSLLSGPPPSRAS